MDIADRGPTLTAGRFSMRITNVGIIGNAFYASGLSFDPSFEYPRGSGHELLHHAELWVGAINERGEPRVSGSPMLEWRPTLDPSDRVRSASAGDNGTRGHFDDDSDGKTDEEQLNGRDEDGDGRVDEDLLLPAQQMLAAQYTDDQRTAVEYAYPNGEHHTPLGLAVHQEAYAWSLPGHDGVAGMAFTITNIGNEVLRDVRLGVYADLDSRESSSGIGHLDDRLDILPYSFLIAPHPDTLEGNWIKQCGEVISGQAALVRDASPRSSQAGVALVPLAHTTDVLGWFVNDAFPNVRQARESAVAPRRDSTFRLFSFISDAPPGQGGPPIIDEDRYAAMAGNYPTSNAEPGHDHAVLVSCGPFKRLVPRQSLSFAIAFVAVPSPESVATAVLEARMLYRGIRLDLQPNAPRGPTFFGATGINGHEACVEPPPGIEFTYDPHCPEKLIRDPLLKPTQPIPPPIIGTEVKYQAGKCVWTDLDCDLCTGDDGVDEIRHWEAEVLVPSQPNTRATPGDHRVLIEWDNEPERAVAAGGAGAPNFRFAGYKIYKLDDWQRQGLLPPPEQWLRLAVFRADTSEGGIPLADIRDAGVLPDGDGPGGPHFPIGRYRFVDSQALNGFDYHYVVTTILREIVGPQTPLAAREYESPFIVSFDDRVVPRATARASGSEVRVVPNPYRGNAPWERQQVQGDVFTRHIDFMGLPRALARIRIYTLAGDLVAILDHDGSNGVGQASWNLISRNGQDVESGVYLFTVSSSLGHQVGKFVLIR